MVVTLSQPTRECVFVCGGGDPRVAVDLKRITALDVGRHLMFGCEFQPSAHSAFRR